jgi:hypothetical protein
MSAPFDAQFLEHPAFSSFDGAGERLRGLGHFPEPHELRTLAPASSGEHNPWFEFELEDPARVRAAGSFDRYIAASGRIPTRPGSYHDLCGALVWLHFPRLKTAIHELQLSAPDGARSPRQNAATHLDESGVLVASSELAVFQALARLEWSELFWQRRTELLETTRFVGFGHGLLDALRAPHPGLLGMALFVLVSPAELALPPAQFRQLLDRELALRLADFLREPAQLRPLPVLGVPGWSREQSPEFYGNERYFRRARQRPRPEEQLAYLALC